MPRIVPALPYCLPTARRALAQAQALEVGAVDRVTLAAHIGALSECLSMLIDGLDAQPTPWVPPLEEEIRFDKIYEA